MILEIKVPKETIKYATDKLRKIEIEEGRGLSKFGSEKNRILVGYIGEKNCYGLFGNRL